MLILFRSFSFIFYKEDAVYDGNYVILEFILLECSIFGRLLIICLFSLLGESS